MSAASTPTTASIATDDQLRHLFRRFNPLMLLFWRLGLGAWVNAWPDVGGRILVLTHTGRKSGRLRRTPLNYALAEGEVYIAAGFGARCDWYRNLQACPEVQVWLPDGWWAGVAEEVTDPAQRLTLLRQVLIGSGVVAPAFGLNPHTLDDAALAAVTEPYRLVHLRRTAARTGPGGPGDLAWVWPFATFLLLARLLRRRLSKT
jgi:deazaflavin-dependent oxidoreductase (nitroreductase family)